MLLSWCVQAFFCSAIQPTVIHKERAGANFRPSQVHAGSLGDSEVSIAQRGASLSRTQGETWKRAWGFVTRPGSVCQVIPSLAFKTYSGPKNSTQLCLDLDLDMLDQFFYAIFSNPNWPTYIDLHTYIECFCKKQKTQKSCFCPYVETAFAPTVLTFLLN